MSAVSMEQTNALKHTEFFKSKPFWEDTESRAAVTFREKVSCGSGNAQSSRLNRELRGELVQRMKRYSPGDRPKSSPSIYDSYWAG